MPIDESVIDLVKSELDAGKKSEHVVAKLRMLGYSDEEIEQIFSHINTKGMTIIKSPSRTTIFKTVFSPSTLFVIFIILLLVGGIYYFITVTFSQETLEEKAKRTADSTPEASLFLKAVELHNALVSCVPSIIPDQSQYAACTITKSEQLQDNGNGKYTMTYSMNEDSKCPKDFIKKTKVLEISIDLVSGSTHSTWLSALTLDQNSIESLYPKRSNCMNLAGYVPQLVNQIIES